jgi:hypothetical protein
MLEKLNLLSAYSFNDVAVKSFVDKILALSIVQKIECWIDPMKLIGRLCEDEYSFYRVGELMLVQHERCNPPRVIARWEACQNTWMFEEDFPWNTLCACTDIMDYTHCGGKRPRDVVVDVPPFGRCSS